jgi:hypothetical protein
MWLVMLLQEFLLVPYKSYTNNHIQEMELTDRQFFFTIALLI